MAAKDPLVRWLRYVNKDGPIPEARPDLGPCWLWTGGCFGNGYGEFYAGIVDGRHRQVPAHAWGYRYYRGPVEGELDHLCRNHLCVNPAHLEDVSHLVNVQRGAAVKELCPQGHVKDYFDKRGYRHCRICRQSNGARYEREHPGYDAAKHRAARRRKREAREAAA